MPLEAQLHEEDPTGFLSRAPIESMTTTAGHDVFVPDEPKAPLYAATGTSASSQAASEATSFSQTPLREIVRVPEWNATPAPYTFDMRGQWEGTVTSIGAEEFTVVLRDILNPGGEEYDATFSIEEVSDEDLDLLQPGAILYWTIGYQMRRGQRLRVSEIRLRRLPAWSRADIARVEKMSEQLDSLFAR